MASPDDGGSLDMLHFIGANRCIPLCSEYEPVFGVQSVANEKVVTSRDKQGFGREYVAIHEVAVAIHGGMHRFIMIFKYHMLDFATVATFICVLETTLYTSFESL